ncbi:flagellar basal body-associated FliL family protein [Gluconobacter morbifer]|uniref:Flagellar protein FliL n=1 Tax=Gluconobacter morbifer G707 TaxID=1088869 RepID=G6XJ98_9PROT|nr:flagellar basal body-associated FliL family protein [Gluconobacter morbifer]EHH68214.1 flagellar FliL protein [Gluconobacter morbifer G707]
MESQETETTEKKGGRRRIMLLAGMICLLLLGGGAFAWRHFHHSAPSPVSAASRTVRWITIPIPPVLSNLDSGTGRIRYVRINAQLEIEDSKEATRISTLMPQIQDAFQTCLHGMRPEELAGSGIYRLRETMLVQITNIVAPLQVRNLFFAEVLVQ